jgi:hypothetical protein
MKKIFITIIALVLITVNTKAQFIIVTNTNDSIECIISELNNGIFHYKTTTRPRHFGTINKKDVRSMVAIGDDTVYSTLQTITGDEEVVLLANNKYEWSENVTDTTAGDHFIKSGNNLIAANILTIATIATSILYINATKELTGALVIAGIGTTVALVLNMTAFTHLIHAGKKIKAKELKH